MGWAPSYLISHPGLDLWEGYARGDAREPLERRQTTPEDAREHLQMLFEDVRGAREHPQMPFEDARLAQNNHLPLVV